MTNHDIRNHPAFAALSPEARETIAHDYEASLSVAEREAVLTEALSAPQCVRAIGLVRCGNPAAPGTDDCGWHR